MKDKKILKKIIGYFEKVFKLKRIMIHLIQLAEPNFKPIGITPNDETNLKVGEGTSISLKAYLDTTASITIGKNCMITSGVKIFTHDHHMWNKREFSYEDKYIISKNPIVIEDNVVIYNNALILPQVKRIHKSCIIGAGAVLTKSTTAPYQIWVGNPAKIIKIKEEEDE